MLETLASPLPIMIGAGGGPPGSSEAFAASSGDQPNNVATTTLTGEPNKRTYLTGFTICGSGATAGLGVVVTVTGVVGGPLSFVYVFSVGGLLSNTPLNVTLPTPLPATGNDVDIVVSCPAGGLGNLHNTVNAYGFRL